MLLFNALNSKLSEVELIRTAAAFAEMRFVNPSTVKIMHVIPLLVARGATVVIFLKICEEFKPSSKAIALIMYCSREVGLNLCTTTAGIKTETEKEKSRK